MESAQSWATDKPVGIHTSRQKEMLNKLLYRKKTDYPNACITGYRTSQKWKKIVSASMRKRSIVLSKVVREKLVVYLFPNFYYLPLYISL